MPSEGSKQVADDPVATETPAGGAEAVASAAEDVEQPAPLPAGSIAEASTSWRICLRYLTRLYLLELTLRRVLLTHKGCCRR